MTFKDFFGKLTSRYLWGHLFAMVLVVALLLTGLYFFLDFYTQHGKTVAVPDVKGQACGVAVRKLEAAGMRVVVSDTGYVARLAADVVLDQSLAPGTQVKLRRIVYLTVNAASPRAIALPDIADNCSLREAMMRLRALGFSIGPVKKITGDRDWVYGVEVNGRSVHAGERISVGKPLTLLVGDGESEEVFNGNDSLDALYFDNDSLAPEPLEELPE